MVYLCILVVCILLVRLISWGGVVIFSSVNPSPFSSLDAVDLES